MRIHFYKQQRGYWCGPACAQMFIGISSQMQLAKKMRTNSRIGTTRQAITTQLLASQKKVTVYRHATISDLRTHVPALVNYQEVEGEDHYAIVLRITKKHVVMHDPWHGPNYRLPLHTFVHRWKNPKRKKKYTGWMVTVR